jgi:hypothetical protein
MIIGHNTDVEYHGEVYHVQTEDKGRSNPVIETLIYQKGKILGSKSTSYAELLAAGVKEKEIQQRLESQHKRMMLDVRGGKYSLEGPPPFGEGFISELSLDQVILKYLESTKVDERIEVIVQGPPDLVFGEDADIDIYVRTELTSKPMAKVAVSINLARPGEGDMELFRGKTNREGKVATTLKLPESQEASAVLIVEAISKHAREEARMLVHRRRAQPVGEPVA